MYYEVVSQCTRPGKLVEGWLDKAATFAENEDLEVDPC